MHGEIITTGNELISGKTSDLNAWYVAGRLTSSGLKVTRITTVGDHKERMTKALMEAVEESRFVIITGGLGSTEDDLTNEIVAQALNRPLCLDKGMFEQIKGYVESRGLRMSPSLEKMAWVPEGAKILNPGGQVCGFSMVEGDVKLYFLPGVPDQMRFLMDTFVIPELLSHCRTLPVLRQRILKLYGLSEPDIAEMIKDLSQKMNDIMLGFYPHFPENHVTISLRGHDEPTVMKDLSRAEKEVRALFGSYVFATGNQTMEDAVGVFLKERGLTLSVAESCTGGLIGDLLTNAAGSSRYFQGGVVVYSNQAKMDLLNVLPDTLETHGAVSDQTVREMACGVRERFKTDLGLSVTGIAGPDGGSQKKPLGTVYIGLAAKEELFSGKYRFWGTRKQVKSNTAMMALDWIRRTLNGDPFLPGI